MSEWRYYEQAHPHSVRRYNDEGVRQRWVPVLKDWVLDCAPESTCFQTGDKLINEVEFAKIEFRIPA